MSLRSVARPLLVLPLLSTLGPAGAAQSFLSAEARLVQPFERLADSGPRGVVTLAFDADDYHELRALGERGGTFALEELPLPGGLTATLDLRPVSAFAPGAQAEIIAADGSSSLLAPDVQCFSGFVQGGGAAFLGITPTALDGYLQLGDELYFLSSGAGSSAGTSGRATLAHASQVGGPPANFCSVLGRALAPIEDVQRSVAGPSVKLADVFIEADDKYRALFPSNQAAVDYATLLITAVSEIYRRDLGAKLRIPNGYLRVWNTTPPWGALTTFNDISKVQSYWSSGANPNRSLPRAAVHVLTNPVFGGVAATIGGICQNSVGYEISSVFGHFPYPIRHTDTDNWDLFVVAHEFGHSFGCIHSFDFSPPIDCQDGSGPDSGTIMSYCHQSFGVGGVGMRFHLREQHRIQSYLPNAQCLTNIPVLSGDYDLDGVRDLDDLIVANAVLVQGFRSLGAEQTFDMDGDGDFDVQDRDLLSALLGAPPASVSERNGSGVNPVCLFSGSKPVLGTTWSSSVIAFGVGRPTFVLVCDRPHPGLATPFGELLVRFPAQGGVKLLTHAAPSDGIMGNHEIPLPLDLGLAGFSASAQGFVLGGPSGTHLCNALDLVLSPYQ